MLLFRMIVACQRRLKLFWRRPKPGGLDFPVIGLSVSCLDGYACWAVNQTKESHDAGSLISSISFTEAMCPGCPDWLQQNKIARFRVQVVDWRTGPRQGLSRATKPAREHGILLQVSVKSQ